MEHVGARGAPSVEGLAVDLCLGCPVLVDLTLGQKVERRVLLEVVEEGVGEVCVFIAAGNLKGACLLGEDSTVGSKEDLEKLLRGVKTRPVENGGERGVLQGHGVVFVIVRAADGRCRCERDGRGEGMSRGPNCRNIGALRIIPLAMVIAGYWMFWGDEVTGPLQIPFMKQYCLIWKCFGVCAVGMGSRVAPTPVK